MRSSATHWTKDSVLAIDAGVHLAAVIRILQEHPSNAQGKGVISGGPFANLKLPHDSAEANGAYIVRELVSAYLITHPHLDHISGFAINTASFQSTDNPKRLAALPSTVNAIKDHIFNDIIWPNLSDENGGAGLVTFMRLEDNALNEGDGRGYVDICDGLSVNCWSVSHGRCMTTRRESRTASSSVKAKQPSQIDQASGGDKSCAYDSAAFFLRDRQTGMEALIFGDVEPDSLSLRPRTALVWSEAATKIVLGTLAGILIECSYDDSQCNELLFGHLCPRHLIVELQVLAEMVQSLEHNEEGAPQRKRTRRSNGVRKHEEHGRGTRRKRDVHYRETNAVYPKPAAADHRDIPGPSGATRPLEGLRVFIIHVKDDLRGGPHAGDMILAQLQEHEEAAQLGCVFDVSKSGTSIWL